MKRNPARPRSRAVAVATVGATLATFAVNPSAASASSSHNLIILGTK